MQREDVLIEDRQPVFLILELPRMNVLRARRLQHSPKHQLISILRTEINCSKCLHALALPLFLIESSLCKQLLSAAAAAAETIYRSVYFFLLLCLAWRGAVHCSLETFRRIECRSFSLFFV